MRSAISLLLALLLLLAAAALPAAAGDTAMRTTTLAVNNMTCAMCPITIRKALRQVPGVESAKVDFKTKTATVRFDPAKTTPEALTEATTQAGYPSTVKP